MPGALVPEAGLTIWNEELFLEVNESDLVETDGEPMDSDWHRRCMNLLIDQIEQHFRDRDDFYVGGNMFIYFSAEQARNKDFRGPDFFFVANTNRIPARRFWIVWREKGRTPNVVIELSSPSTVDEDHGPKFAIYRDKLKVGDYFIFDPDTNILEGWRLVAGEYEPLATDVAGRLYSQELELSLGIWERDIGGFRTTWLRFFDGEGKVLPTPMEAERAHANAEKQRANAEKQRANAEKQRADSAEAENARLRALLAKQSGSTNGVNPH